MNTASLFNFLSTTINFSPLLKDELLLRLRQEKYKAHQILHSAGQNENRIYFLETGFARNYYYDKRGDEHTVKFWEPGEIMFSYQGYYKVPSYFYTEIVEETELITLNYNDLHDLDKKFPEISELIKAMLLKYQQEEYEKQKLIAMPAEERYRLFHKNRPGIFQKVPSRIIASYLNMSRETLTRFIGKR